MKSIFHGAESAYGWPTPWRIASPHPTKEETCKQGEKSEMPEAVAITGASAGVGRAAMGGEDRATQRCTERLTNER